MLKHLALSENGFLFDTRTGNTFTVGGTGTFILRLLIAGEALDAVRQRLLGEFGVQEEIAARDLDDFMLRLDDLGLTAA